MTTLYDILKGSLGTPGVTPGATPSSSVAAPGSGMTGSGPLPPPTYSLPNGGGQFNTNGPVDASGTPNASVLSPDQMTAAQGIFAPKTPAYTPPSHDELAGTFNKAIAPAPTTTDPEAAPSNSPFDETLKTATSNPLGTIYKLREEQASDRFNNTGAYYVDPAWGLSPDEVRQKRNSADNHYEQVQAALQLGATQQIYQMKNALGGDFSGIPVRAQGAAQQVQTQYTQDANKTLAPTLVAASKANSDYNDMVKQVSNGGTIPAPRAYALIEQFQLAQTPGVSVKKAVYDTINGMASSYPKAVQAELSKFTSGLYTGGNPADPASYNGVPTASLSLPAAKALLDIINSNAEGSITSFNQNNRSNWVNNLKSLGLDQATADRLLPPQGQSGYGQAPTPGDNFDVAGFTREAQTMGKSPEEIKAYLQSKGHTSFNTVGNTTASNGIISGVDITKYATDPLHEKKISSIVGSMNIDASNPDVLDSYIKSIAPSSSVTGNMIANAAQVYNVDPKLITAIIQNDSTFGTKGKAVRTNNPGNVGNDDAGNMRKYSSVDNGVMAVAHWLSNHKTS